MNSTTKVTAQLNMHVAVTGAAGYLASWIVDALLNEGHIVHATVRDTNDHQKISHLLDLSDRFPGQLLLFEADLLVDGSFDQALAGCSIVIHTASPYTIDKPKNPEDQLIRPALNGTLNVVASVNRTNTVRRVVLTSSIAALYNDACDVGPSVNHTVQESSINHNTVMRHNPYAYSKTVAEHAAWEAQKLQSRWELITIHPGAIFGPSLSKRADATSVDMIIKFLKGSFRSGVPGLWLGVVDVRDVAAAHVQAATVPAANGRYTVVAQSLSLLEIGNLLRVGNFGIENKMPKREVSKALFWLIAPFVGMQRRYVARNVNHPIYFNNDRCKRELGIRYRQPTDTFHDHVRQIIADGLL
jgi:nucleoside-diphosphate-sugar epimerase